MNRFFVIHASMLISLPVLLAQPGEITDLSADTEERQITRDAYESFVISLYNLLFREIG